MKKSSPQVACYVAGVVNRRIDPILEGYGVCRGMIVFAIPELGLLFRCRASGEPVDLEFGAMFALVKFVEEKLAGERIRSVHIFSSNPEFVFSFTGSSRHLEKGSARMQLLAEYGRRFRISIAYIEPVKNKALMSPADYPSVPVTRSVRLKLDRGDLSKSSFRPLQMGIKL